jgi:hypothetical protein
MRTVTQVSCILNLARRSAQKSSILGPNHAAIRTLAALVGMGLDYLGGTCDGVVLDEAHGLKVVP